MTRSDLRPGLPVGVAALALLAACSRPSPAPPSSARDDSPATSAPDTGDGATLTRESTPEPNVDAAAVEVAPNGEEPSPEVDPVRSPNVSSPEEFERLALPLVCARAVRCGTIGRSQLEDCLLGEGKSRLSLVWGFRDLLKIDELAAAGRLGIDLSRTGECLDVLRSEVCRFDVADVPPGCLGGAERVYQVPAVLPGEPCTRWGECVDGYCSANGMCEGKCLARARTGERCGIEGASGLCVESDFCNNYICEPRRKEGESCPGHWQACQPGLWCEGWIPENDDPAWGSPERPGICAEPKGVGAPCAVGRSDEICRSNLYCDWGGDPPVCSERLGEGAECRWLDACADGLICIGLRLGGVSRYGNRLAVVAPGRCSAHLDAGDACDPEDFVNGCPGSMTCDKTAKTCRSTCHEGDPCDSSWCPSDRPPDERCDPEGCCGALYCDPRTNKCTRQAESGERCTPTRFGVDDNPCFLGTCDARRRTCDPGCRE